MARPRREGIDELDMSGSTAPVVPVLRFPAFRRLPGWRTVPLDTVAARVLDRNEGGTVTRVLTNSAEHGVLDQRDYFDREIATTGKTEDYYVVEKGDFVYNPRTSAAAPVGPVSRNNLGTGVMSPLYTAFRFNLPNSDFYEHFFRSTAWHPYLRSASSTGARHDRMAITPGVFMRMPVPVPQPAEQQKIADCLTSLDECVAAQGRKVDALKAHKKGLMQHLFPQEGQTLPRLRFPEFHNAAAWEQATVGSRSMSFSGGTPTTTNKDYYGGTIPFIRSAEIAEESTELTLTEYGLEHSAAKVVQKGDVLVALYGANSGDVALSRMDGAINQAILCLRPAGSREFLYHALTERKDWILKTFLQGGQGNLSGDIVKSIPLRFPLPEEQTAVARCLSSIDQLIEATNASVSGLRKHKTGMMQRLFPQIMSD